MKKLRKAGISQIEVGSLVHPSILPMRKSEKLYRKTGGDLLVLNQRGLQRALVAGAEEVNVSISPFDRFMRLNQNMSYDEAKLFYERLATQIPINRLYISCCFSSEVTKNQVLECIMWGKSPQSGLFCVILTVMQPQKRSSSCAAKQKSSQTG